MGACARSLQAQGDMSEPQKLQHGAVDTLALMALRVFQSHGAGVSSTASGDGNAVLHAILNVLRDESEPGAFQLRMVDILITVLQRTAQ